jgi:hypothetical protein
MPPRKYTRLASSENDSQPAAKRLRSKPRTNPKIKRRRRSETEEIACDPLQTDSTKVTSPVIEAVDNNLHDAYKVHSVHQMCYIFDFVTPGRQWKAGSEWTEDGPDAEYGYPPWPALTEIEDKDGYGQQAYYPRKLE